MQAVAASVGELANETLHHDASDLFASAVTPASARNARRTVEPAAPGEDPAVPADRVGG